MGDDREERLKDVDFFDLTGDDPRYTKASGAVDEQHRDDKILTQGVLSSGKPWCLVNCSKNAVEGHGRHMILRTVDRDPMQNLTAQERGEMFDNASILARAISSLFRPSERYRISLNSPELATRPHFHIHIIILSDDAKVMRLTDSIVVDQGTETEAPK